MGSPPSSIQGDTYSLLWRESRGLYVGLKLVDPRADAGFDLSAEYDEAKKLSGLVGDRRE
jgi:hypothetical protein